MSDNTKQERLQFGKPRVEGFAKIPNSLRRNVTTYEEKTMGWVVACRADAANGMPFPLSERYLTEASGVSRGKARAFIKKLIEFKVLIVTVKGTRSSPRKVVFSSTTPANIEQPNHLADHNYQGGTYLESKTQPTTRTTSKVPGPHTQTTTLTTSPTKTVSVETGQNGRVLPRSEPPTCAQNVDLPDQYTRTRTSGGCDPTASPPPDGGGAARSEKRPPGPNSWGAMWGKLKRHLGNPEAPTGGPLKLTPDGPGHQLVDDWALHLRAVNVLYGAYSDWDAVRVAHGIPSGPNALKTVFINAYRAMPAGTGGERE